MPDSIIELHQATVRYNLAAHKNRSLKEYVSGLLHRDLLFQEFLALQDIDLTVLPGESWGIIGRNGSGKSTLLKLISGILRPYQGTVAVHGTVAPLLELGAGFDMELTGRENIFMNGLILGMTEHDINSRFDEIVAFAELEKFLDVPLKNYSSGMKSRLGFSIATCTHADILIADEVLSTGDKVFQQKCEERMRQLLSGGTTLLFVSHSETSVRRLCKKCLWLEEGHSRMCGNTADVLPSYTAAK